MASAPGDPKGGLILKDLVEGITDGEQVRRGAEVLADGRCVPRSRYLLRSVAEERVVQAKTCTYVLRGTLCEMRLEHILPRLLHPVFHINGRTILHRTSPSPSSYFSSAPGTVFLFISQRLLCYSMREKSSPAIEQFAILTAAMRYMCVGRIDVNY